MHNYNITENEKKQVKKIANQKQHNIIIAGWFAEMGQILRANRVKECSNYIMYQYCAHCHHSDIIAANYCKDRFCAICAPKRANKIRYQILQAIAPYLENEHYDWLFLTLTLRNVNADNLRKTVTEMLQATKKLFDRRSIERAVKGYIRSLEITYNKTHNNYHPHIHMLLMVDREQYYKRGQYITQETWANMWKEAMAIEYVPVTDVRRIHNKGDTDSIKPAVIETAKYPIKLYQVPSAEVLAALDTALKGKQLIAAGGLLREHWRIAKDNEPKPCCANPDITQHLYKWHVNGYNIVNQD